LRNLAKLLVGFGSLSLGVIFPATALAMGWRAARAIHGTHCAYVAGILKGMGA
jgi:hypothetical protein